MVKIEIELAWAKKFRELQKIYTLKDAKLLISDFNAYCDQEEERIARKYKEMIEYEQKRGN